MESTQVHLRLSNDVWARYSALSQAQGVTLGAYLRKRLEEQDQLLAGELASLRRAVERSTTAPAPAPAGTSSPHAGALIEVLLLLRLLAGPQKAALVQKEVERRGLEMWR